MDSNHTPQSHSYGERLRRPLLLIGAVLCALALFALSACGVGKSPESQAGNKKIVIATDDGTEKHWQILKKKLKDDGIDLDVKTFSDGNQINQATQNGSVDINLFQHIAFLAQFNVKNKGDLVPVGATAVYPLALYSKKYSSLKKLPNNAEIAIPNNPTNQARALRNLQNAGLLKLKGGGNSLSTPADVTRSKVKITAVDTNQTVNALDGGAAAAVVNNTQAQKGGLSDDNIVYKDDLDATSNDPYINAFVTKAGKKDDPRWPKLVAAYHSKEVEAAVTKVNGGNLKFKADWTVGKLDKLLTSEEKVAKSGEGKANSSAQATPSAG